MIRTIFVTALFALVAATASAQTIDANGKCHDSKGRMAKMDVCKAAKPAAERCRDKTTKTFAKCSAPNTEPVPAKK